MKITFSCSGEALRGVLDLVNRLGCSEIHSYVNEGYIYMLMH